MAVDVVTGLTESEEKEIDQAIKPIFTEHKISTMYQPYYLTFAKTIMKRSKAEAQIELNTWKSRGLDKNILIQIASSICNKDLV